MNPKFATLTTNELAIMVSAIQDKLNRPQANDGATSAWETPTARLCQELSDEMWRRHEAERLART